MTCVRLTRIEDWTDFMKFRQGLIASATAAAVLTSGVTAANAEQTTPNTSAPTTTAPVQKDASSLKDMDPREVKEWISVATAILALLGSIYTFADRYFLK